MLYLIGLGLDLKDLSVKALEAIKKCKKVYLECYTAKFPYTQEDLRKTIKKKFSLANRALTESNFFIEESKDKDIALLIYGDPLAATTHITLMKEAKARVIHSTSILTSISETGLQLYRFGKTTSLPKWQENYKPTSFFKIIQDNLSIDAHTVVLVDIGLSFLDALNELEEVSDNSIKKIIVLSRAGSKDQKIVSGSIDELKKEKIKEPFCFIIPSKLSFGEEILV